MSNQKRTRGFERFKKYIEDKDDTYFKETPDEEIEATRIINQEEIEQSRQTSQAIDDEIEALEKSLGITHEEDLDEELDEEDTDDELVEEDTDDELDEELVEEDTVDELDEDLDEEDTQEDTDEDLDDDEIGSRTDERDAERLRLAQLKALRRERKEVERQLSLMNTIDGKEYAKKRDKFRLISRGSRFLMRAIVVIYFLCIFVGGAVLFFMFQGMIEDVPDLNEEALVHDARTSVMYDVNGNQLVELGHSKREVLSVEAMTDNVKDSIILVEDKRFYQHHGFDMIRLVRAVQVSLMGHFGDEGASTLTQQLAKLAFLDQNESTLNRKAEELYLAWQIEDNYTKDEIVNMYFNMVYMGNGIYGMETAAQYYYGQSYEDLHPFEQAVLVGTVNNPEIFNPYAEDTERVKGKRDTILMVYRDEGYITPEEYDAYVQVPIGQNLIPPEQNVNSTYFTLNTIDNRLVTPISQAIREAETHVSDLYTGGYQIYTSIDPSKQLYAHELVTTNEHIRWPDSEMMVSVTLLNNQTGMVEFSDGGNRSIRKELLGFNYVYDLFRQPGSVIKPVLNYAPYMDTYRQGADDMIEDNPVHYTSGQQIHNYWGDYKGHITLAEALASSRNTPAYRAFSATGFNESFDMAEKFGLDFTNQRYESAALGGVPNATSFNLARAFSVFPNEGEYKPFRLINSINQDGVVIYNNNRPSTHIITRQTAEEMNKILRQVVTRDYGTATELRMENRYIAGKTGTTNYSEDEHEAMNIPDRAAPDIWFVGYDKNYTVAIWVGYEERRNYIPLNQQNLAKELAEEIWRNYLVQTTPIKNTEQYTEETEDDNDDTEESGE